MGEVLNRNLGRMEFPPWKRILTHKPSGFFSIKRILKHKPKNTPIATEYYEKWQLSTSRRFVCMAPSQKSMLWRFASFFLLLLLFPCVHCHCEIIVVLEDFWWAFYFGYTRNCHLDAPKPLWGGMSFDLRHFLAASNPENNLYVLQRLPRVRFALECSSISSLKHTNWIIRDRIPISRRVNPGIISILQ